MLHFRRNDRQVKLGSIGDQIIAVAVQDDPPGGSQSDGADAVVFGIRRIFIVQYDLKLEKAHSDGDQ